MTTDGSAQLPPEVCSQNIHILEDSPLGYPPETEEKYPFPSPLEEKSAPSFYREMDGFWRQWSVLVRNGFHVVPILDRGEYGTGYGSFCTVSLTDIPGYPLSSNAGRCSNTLSLDAAQRILRGLELRERVYWAYPSENTGDVPSYFMLALH